MSMDKDTSDIRIRYQFSYLLSKTSISPVVTDSQVSLYISDFEYVLAEVVSTGDFEKGHLALHNKVPSCCEGFSANGAMCEFLATESTDRVSNLTESDWRDGYFHADGTLESSKNLLLEVCRNWRPRRAPSAQKDIQRTNE